MGNSKAMFMAKAIILNAFILKTKMKFTKVNIHLKKCEIVKPTKTEEEQRINLIQSESNRLENKTK